MSTPATQSPGEPLAAEQVTGEVVVEHVTPETVHVTPADLPVAEPADRVRAAALEVPGVSALHGGAFGEVGTYLPGRRVAGVRLAEGDRPTEVHVTVTMGSDVRAVAAAVRDAVAAVVPGRVDVTVEDVVPA